MKKKRYGAKILLLMSLAILLFPFSFLGVEAEGLLNYVMGSEKRASEENEISKVNSTEGGAWICDQPIPLEKTMLFADGRLFLPKDEIETALIEMGIEKKAEIVSEESDLNPKKIADLTVGSQTYISINHLSEQWGLWPVFDDEGIHLYLAQEGEVRTKEELSIDQEERLMMACLRLEDFTANPGKDSGYSHVNLEKVRILAEWLFAENQEYSVAWIPLYTNPREGIENDLTKTFNFYNADFIYTLDVLSAKGGRIGLHGLTHQDGETESGVGFEFGESTPFSKEEVKERFERAKGISETLGYLPEFFEFPHYAMTDEQAELAKNYFSVIYQQDGTKQPYGYLEMQDGARGKVLFVPTPANYVENRYDLEGMLSRLSYSRDKGVLVSLFFHPPMDYEQLQCYTSSDGVRHISYEEEESILGRITRQIEDWDMRFQIPWEQGEEDRLQL